MDDKGEVNVGENTKETDSKIYLSFSLLVFPLESILQNIFQNISEDSLSRDIVQ